MDRYRLDRKLVSGAYAKGRQCGNKLIIERLLQMDFELNTDFFCTCNM